MRQNAQRGLPSDSSLTKYPDAQVRPMPGTCTYRGSTTAMTETQVDLSSASYKAVQEADSGSRAHSGTRPLWASQLQNSSDFRLGEVFVGLNELMHLTFRTA